MNASTSQGLGELPKASPTLRAKLRPQRFPTMGRTMSAILGFLVDEPCPNLRIDQVWVTKQGHVLAKPAGQSSANAYVGMVDVLVQNLKNIFIAANLTKAERFEAACLVLHKIPEIKI